MSGWDNEIRYKFEVLDIIRERERVFNVVFEVDILRKC